METQTIEKTIENGAFGEKEVASDVLCLRTMIVNVVLVGEPGAKSGDWVLVDTGLGASAQRIIDAATNRFGADSMPRAIVLTHGHFDHVGSAIQLADHWGVEIYAHELEIPYLTGQTDYPPPDPHADPGLMAQLSVFFPRNSTNLGDRIKALPPDGSVPPMPEWRWVHTPGHTPGHISLFRERDGVLVAGDAFTTVRQESAYAVLSQRQEVHGPPSYFTPDWQAAVDSINRLKELKPSVAATGHGIPMAGEALSQGLETLATEGPAKIRG